MAKAETTKKLFRLLQEKTDIGIIIRLLEMERELYGIEPDFVIWAQYSMDLPKMTTEKQDGVSISFLYKSGLKITSSALYPITNISYMGQTCKFEIYFVNDFNKLLILAGICSYIDSL